MPRSCRAGLLLGTLLAATAAPVVLTIRGQERAPTSASALPVPATPAPAGGSVQDALLRPFHFAFARPTPLDQVARNLTRSLGVRVVIDRAALDRLGLRLDDEVQLELDGVRLKTGLRLLLDQLDLTYRVVPEDNLLVFTDLTGADDPVDRILTEVDSLHRDLHDLRDAVDDIRAALGLDDEAGARMRKPTIIEEVPAELEKPDDPPAPNAAQSRPTRPGA